MPVLKNVCLIKNKSFLDLSIQKNLFLRSFYKLWTSAQSGNKNNEASWSTKGKPGVVYSCEVSSFPSCLPYLFQLCITGNRFKRKLQQGHSSRVKCLPAAFSPVIPHLHLEHFFFPLFSLSVSDVHSHPFGSAESQQHMSLCSTCRHVNIPLPHWCGFGWRNLISALWTVHKGYRSGRTSSREKRWNETNRNSIYCKKTTSSGNRFVKWVSRSDGTNIPGGETVTSGWKMNLLDRILWVQSVLQTWSHILACFSRSVLWLWPQWLIQSKRALPEQPIEAGVHLGCCVHYI